MTRRKCPFAGAFRSVRTRWRSGPESGLTAVELMVVLVTIGIVAASLMPLVGSAVADGRTKGGAQQVVEALRVARQNAITATYRYQVVINSSSVQITCASGTPAGTVCPAARPPDRTMPFADLGLTLTVAPAGLDSTVSFDPDGSASPGTVTVAYPGAAAWQVAVNAPGRVRACTPSCS